MMFKRCKNVPCGTGVKYLWLVLCLCVFSSFSANAQTDAQAGARTFLMFCAGCHGQDGFATYEHAPSFSMGEHLQKDDRELLQSVLKGTGNMPSWENKLSVQDLRNAIAYIRLMHERNVTGEPPLQNEKADRQYLFKPFGEQDMGWRAREGK